MAYSYNNKGTKYHKDAGTWKKIALWGSADNIELDVGALANIPAGMSASATLEAFLIAMDSAFGVADGFATLGGDGKLASSQLPAAVAGGMNFIGATLAAEDIENIMSSNIAAVPVDADKGKFMIVTSGGELTNSTGNSANHVLQSPGEEGDSTFPITLEPGDWLILLDVNTSTTTYTWGIIDNDYLEANTTEFGVTRLSNAANRAGLSGNDVVTEGILATILNDDILVDSDFGSAGFMKSNGSGGYSIDASTYLTGYVAKDEALTGYSEKVSFAEITSSDDILSALEQLAYTAKTAYNWGDHAGGGYQGAGDAIGLDASGAGANADSKLITFNYVDGASAPQTLTMWAEGTEGRIYIGGSAINTTPLASMSVSASVPTTEGNDGDFMIVTG